MATGLTNGSGIVYQPVNVDWIDVKNYGAYGDAKKVTDAVLTSGSGVVTSATASFTGSDVGKKAFVLGSAGQLRITTCTVTAVTSPTSITLSASPSVSGGGNVLVWGHDDSDAVRAAVSAACAMTPAATVYLPSGGYIFSKCPFVLNPGSTLNANRGPSIRGAGSADMAIYFAPTFDFTTVVAGGSMLVSNISCAGPCYIGGLFVDGLNYAFSGSGYSVLRSTTWSTIEDVYILNPSGLTTGLSINGSNEVEVRRFRIEGAAAGMNGIYVFASSVAFFDCLSSNSGGYNLQCQNIRDDQNLQYNVRWYGGLIDECSLSSVSIESNSSAVSFIGTKIFGGNNNYGISVDGTSRVDITNTQVEPFGTSGNRSGITVAAGGVVSLCQTRLGQTGTGKSLNNSGTVYDCGGNTIPDVTGNAPIQFSSLPALTVSQLPAAGAANKGARAFVTDANATTFLSTVAAGGANVVPVFSDGTNWKIG